MGPKYFLNTILAGTFRQGKMFVVFDLTDSQWWKWYYCVAPPLPQGPIVHDDFF